MVRYSIVGALCLLAGACIAGASQHREERQRIVLDELVVKKLIVVDEQGTERIILHTNPKAASWASVRVCYADGTAGVSLIATDPGSLVNIADRQGTVTIGNRIARYGDPKQPPTHTWP